ncbi:Smr/MutS family protein [Desulfobotulus sp. H1]|uniref:Smr/MutS family protein n=1 Tax=Desulfobotulus pelophilus TaxID=2823377 RepID=A0ABT3N815_9BACT|nr:Smr/MutS family protein [Desulfobotulus pelophilus]MCW7753595.1 Smr/MutS family protein [Desulfobotulus pelophilus]
MSVFEGLQQLFRKKSPQPEVPATPSPNPDCSGEKPPSAAAAFHEKPPATQSVLTRHKNNIPRLDKAAEAFFTDEPASPPEKITRTPSPKRETSAPAPKKTRRTTTRSGLPLLDGEKDLFRAMLSPRGNGDESNHKLPSHARRQQPSPAGKKQKPLLKDKNGIPLLRNQTDFTMVFREETKYGGKATESMSVPATGAAARKSEPLDFSVQLRNSLGDKGTERLLKEKKTGVSQGPGISLKERLRRYPAPQKNLDLHGFSGIQAHLKTEIFLQQAKEDGLFTVRIITGRGRNSQGPAVLPDIVDQKIREMAKTGLILSWQWGNDSREPGGSVLVYINHFDTPGRPLPNGR